MCLSDAFVQSNIQMKYYADLECGCNHINIYSLSKCMLGYSQLASNAKIHSCCFIQEGWTYSLWCTQTHFHCLSFSLSLFTLFLLPQTLLPHLVPLPNPWPPLALLPSSCLPSREHSVELAGPPRRWPINRAGFALMMPVLMSLQLLQRWIGRINVGSLTSASLFYCHSLLSCVVDWEGKCSQWLICPHLIWHSWWYFYFLYLISVSSLIYSP